MTDTPRSPKLLLIDIPGADWRLIGPLLDAGHLPHLDALIGRGSVANLAGAIPLRVPVSSTNLASGVLGDVHGIVSPVVADEGVVRPVHSGDVKAPALWDYVAAAGGKAARVGWPVDYPVAKDAALTVSDVFALSRGDGFDSWPLDPLSISADLPQDLMYDLRLHQREVSAQMLLPFVEAPTSIDLETDERMGLLAATLARTSTLHGVATWIAETQDWDCLALHFDFIERLTTGFLSYMPPQMPHVTDTDFTIYQNVVDGAYRFFDLLLQRYIELVGDACTVMITSSHGYHLGAQRLAPMRKGTAFAASMYRSLGILAAAGPRIKPDELVFGPVATDIVPTALALLGLPIAQSLPGKVISDIFVDDISPASTGDVPSAKACEPVTLEPDFINHRLSELVQLGYVSAFPSDMEAACEGVDIMAYMARADLLSGKMRFKSALAQIDSALVLAPDHEALLIKSVHCHLALKDIAACRAVLEDLKAVGAQSALVDYLWGRLALEEKDPDAAAANFGAAETKLDRGQQNLRLLESLGRGWLSLKDFDRAKTTFQKALALDGDDPLANAGLGMVVFAQDEYSAAIDAFKRSLGALQHQPNVHSYLGQSYFKLGDTGNAAACYRAALAIAPDFGPAKQGLVQLGHAIAKSAVQSQAEDA